MNFENQNQNEADIFEEGTIDFSSLTDLLSEENDNPDEGEGSGTEAQLEEGEGTVDEGTEEGEGTKTEDDDEGTKTEVEETEEEEGKSGSAEVKEEEEEGKEVSTGTEGTLNFTSIKNKLIEDGMWQDVNLQAGEDEIVLSEMDNLDEETFLAILKEQDKLKEDNIKNSSIDKDGLDDVTLKLVEISRNGGDITEIVKQYEEHVHPLQGLDLKDPRVHEALVNHQLTKIQKVDPVVAQAAIEKYRESGMLEGKAKEVIENTNKIFNKYLDDKNNKALEEKQNKAKKAEEFSKNVFNRFKDVYKLDEKLSKNLSDFGSDKNAVMSKVEEILSDPEKATDFLFSLEDPEAYLKYKTKDADREGKIKTLKTISIIQKEKTKKSSTTDKENNEEEDSSFTFNEIG